MKILIVYGTNSGGTQVASELIRDTLTPLGHVVTLVRGDMAHPETFTEFDMIILGSCTWELITKERRFEGNLQQHMIQLRTRLKGWDSQGKPFAVFGLGDSSYTNFCIAASHLEALVAQIKGRKVGDTLRVDKFFFFLDENVTKVREWARQLHASLIAIKQ